MKTSFCHTGALLTAILAVVTLVIIAPAEVRTIADVTEPAKTVLGSVFHQ